MHVHKEYHVRRRSCRGIRARLVWRYLPTSEWITGRTIYSKPLSGGPSKFMKEDARLTDSLSHPSRWWWSHPSLRCPSSTLRLLVLPRARASLSAGFLQLLSILYPVLACQPFILYQDESVRVGPNIKGDGSPLARDRDTEIRRSDTEVRDFLIGGPGRVSSGRSLRGKRRFREPRTLQSFLYGSWCVDCFGSLLDCCEYIALKYAGWGVQWGSLNEFFFVKFLGSFFSPRKQLNSKNLERSVVVL